MSIKMPIAMLAAVAILAMIGCGGGSDSTASSSSDSTSVGAAESNSGGSSSQGSESTGGGASGGMLTKAQFVKQANALCGQERLKLLRDVGAYVQAQEGQAQGDATVAASKAVVAPGMEIQIEKIRELGAPAESAKQVDAFLAAWQVGAEKASEISTPGEFEQLFVPAGKLARKLGLSECAYG